MPLQPRWHGPPTGCNRWSIFPWSLVCRAAERQAALEKEQAAKKAAADAAAKAAAAAAAAPAAPAAPAAEEAAAPAANPLGFIGNLFGGKKEDSQEEVPAAPAGTPANVAEARAWIANWKAKQQQQPEAAAAPPTPAAEPAPAPARAPTAAAPAQQAAGSDGVPANVAEARAWIANWKAKSAAAPAAAAPAEAADVPANVAEARAWIANWKSKRQ